MKLAITETDWESWKQNNADGYGWGIFGFAEHWANLMEAEIINDDFASISDERVWEISRSADNDWGITGQMWDYARRILVTAWVHGEPLACWNDRRQAARKAERERWERDYDAKAVEA